MWLNPPTKQQCNAILGEFGLTNITQTRMLAQGLSNYNFYVEANQQTYLLKCFRYQFPKLALEQQKHMVTKQAIIGVSEQHHCALFQYLAGRTMMVSDYHIGKVVKALRLLHQQSCESNRVHLNVLFSPFNHLCQYQQLRPCIDKALAEIESFVRHEGFCHNDLVLENILKTESDLVFIDYEYAGNNDVFFDLAAISESFTLNRQEQEALLKEYCRTAKITLASSDALSKLSAYQHLYNALCCLWYYEKGMTELAKPLLTRLVASHSRSD